MINSKDLPDESELKPLEFADRRLKEWFDARAEVWKLEGFIVEFLQDSGHPDIMSIDDFTRLLKGGRSLMLHRHKHGDFQALLDQYLAARNKVILLQGVAEEYYHEPKTKKGAFG